MATRLTYTTGSRNAELDRAFEMALAEARERVRVPDFGAALAEANAVPYGLTAGAGATTGAWPGVQSFCGWKSSGLTGKGGLRPYHGQPFRLVQSRTIVQHSHGRPS